jgi:hypothetical protein
MYDRRALSTVTSTHGAQSEAGTDRPFLLVKVTGYRLLTTAVIATFGTVKAVASLKGAAVTATALAWILGVVLGPMYAEPPGLFSNLNFDVVGRLYWLGLYENVKPPVTMWFFHEGYSLDLFYISCAGVIASE